MAEEQSPKTPRVGKDEWVATHEGRTAEYSGPIGFVQRLWETTHPGWRLVVFAAAAAIFPFLTSSDFHVRIGVQVLLFAILALGLNVTVGWAGMLDLGYVAFYGFGAYAYAFMSSDQFDLHWPTETTIIIVVIATAALGFLLGLPSRRLSGDYLAIITLFFAQAFVEFTTNGNRFDDFGLPEVDVTGGPNGIPGVDQFKIFGIQFDSISDYFFLLLIFVVVVVVALHRVAQSRIGRAWNAIREDPLAAEAMTIPVNRLRLLAFAFGAATAGLAGSVFAAVQQGVFPTNFAVTFLIMIYAALVLGGTGSMSGAVLGAIVVASVPNILRSPDPATWLFYLALLTGLVLLLRHRWKLLGVLGGVVALGFVLRGIVAGAWPGTVADAALRDSDLAGAFSSWMVVLDTQSNTAGNVAFVALIVCALAFTMLSGYWRTAMLIPIVYLAAFTWENRLVFEAGVTRQLLFGAILIILMASRPQGLLGTPRVEIT
ncbi:MAG: branched-chain amino acid ABC transporter permease [Gaiellaceae bacterium]